MHVDGRPTCEPFSGEDLHIEFGTSRGTLAQLPGASFYHRLRERFGRPGALKGSAPLPRSAGRSDPGLAVHGFGSPGFALS